MGGHQAAIEGNAHDCHGPDGAEQVDHRMHEVRLGVVQQAGLVQYLQEPWPHQEQPDQDPLGAQASDLRPCWVFAWPCT